MTFAMAPGSCACQSLCINSPADLTEQNELASVQDTTREFNIESDEASTKAPTPPKALTLLLVSLSNENLFTKFMKMFMETT